MQKPATPFAATTSWIDLSNQRPRASPCRNRRAASLVRGWGGGEPVSRTRTRIACSTTSRSSRAGSAPSTRRRSRIPAHERRLSVVRTPGDGSAGRGSSTICRSARSSSGYRARAPVRIEHVEREEATLVNDDDMRLSGYVLSSREAFPGSASRRRAARTRACNAERRRRGPARAPPRRRAPSPATPPRAAVRRVRSGAESPPVSANPGLTLTTSGVSSQRYQSSQNGSSQLSAGARLHRQQPRLERLASGRRARRTPPPRAASPRTRASASSGRTSWR